VFRRTTDSELISLYEAMARIRATELVQTDLWERGLISGEMHTGIGEEGIIAGIHSHLGPGDAVACDHRPTGPFVSAGVDVTALLLEMLGHDEGLNHGRAGHMHLMSPEHLITADGIVGASGPAACGFALSSEHLRPGSVAVAYFGEGALNQGMLMESFNLAKTWGLPVLFVCKDNGWSITTRSSVVRSGSPLVRAAGFDLHRDEVKGSDVVAVSRVAAKLINRIRRRREPAFLHARCARPDGHFLGDPLLRVVGHPVAQAREIGGPLAAAARRPEGVGSIEKTKAASELARRLVTVALGRSRQRSWDPVGLARRRLEPEVAEAIDGRVAAEIGDAAVRALALVGASR
jgi:TPP-dependent pyruvate/acetoin dehydrogenase alpha subunit